jgi:hypothetical protein
MPNCAPRTALSRATPRRVTHGEVMIMRPVRCYVARCGAVCCAALQRAELGQATSNCCAASVALLLPHQITHTILLYVERHGAVQRIAVLSHAKRHSTAGLRLYCAVLCYVIRIYYRALMRCTTLYSVLLCGAVLRGSAALD